MTKNSVHFDMFLVHIFTFSILYYKAHISTCISPDRTLPCYIRSLYVVNVSSDVPRGRLRSSACRIRIIKKKILFLTKCIFVRFSGHRPYLMRARHGRRANRKISTYVFVSPRCFVSVLSPIRDTITVNKSTEPCVFRLRAHCTRLVANHARIVIVRSRRLSLPSVSTTDSAIGYEPRYSA